MENQEIIELKKALQLVIDNSNALLKFEHFPELSEQILTELESVLEWNVVKRHEVFTSWSTQIKALEKIACNWSRKTIWEHLDRMSEVIKLSDDCVKSLREVLIRSGRMFRFEVN